MSDVLFKNARVYRNHAFETADVLVCSGKIDGIGPDLNAPAGCEVVDLTGLTLVPGFIDLHTHGGNGIDVNAATAQDLDSIGAFFAKHGTTGWQCSILTDTEEQTLWCIDQAKAAMAAPATGAKLLGIHLEGPFLAPEYKGAMPEDLLRKGDAKLFRRYQKAAEGAIHYMTVSPEVEGVPEMIAEIAGEVTIAIGHSGADYETAMQAIANGAKVCTHTFNAMGLFHQHRPGMMGAALESDIFCEAICDGRHLHPGSVRMLLKCKGWDKVVAITDSIQAAGLPDGHYKLGVNDVVVVDGDAKLASTGVRAGSTLSQDTALRNIMAFTGHPAEDVIPLLSENPARAVGIFDRKGSIETGKDADFAVFDADWTVRRTIVGGTTVYQA